MSFAGWGLDSFLRAVMWLVFWAFAVSGLEGWYGTLHPSPAFWTMTLKRQFRNPVHQPPTSNLPNPPPPTRPPHPFRVVCPLPPIGHPLGPSLRDLLHCVALRHLRATHFVRNSVVNLSLRVVWGDHQRLRRPEEEFKPRTTRKGAGHGIPLAHPLRDRPLDTF